MKRRRFRILIVSLVVAQFVLLSLCTLLLFLVYTPLETAEIMVSTESEISKETISELPKPRLIEDSYVLDDFAKPQMWQGTEKISYIPGALTLHSNADVAEAYRALYSPDVLPSYLYLDINIKNHADIEWLTLYLMPTIDGTEYFECNLLPLTTDGAGRIIVNKMDFIAGAGSPSWNDISTIKLAFQSKESTSAAVTISEIGAYEATAKCTIWFDDGWKSTYTQAFDIMQQSNMPGILSVISSHVGYEDYCTEANLDALYAAGWDLVNHTESHANLTTLSPSDAKAQIINGRDYLISRGFSRAADHFVPPYFATNEIIDDFISENAISSRDVSKTYNRLPVVDKYHLGLIEVAAGTSPETVFTWIDTAVENDLWLVLMFHSIATPADTPTKYPIEDFRTIIDYLNDKQSDIETVTLSQMVDYEAFAQETEQRSVAQTAQLSGGQHGELVWQDDFLADELQKNAWNAVEAAPFKNNELQTYRSDNILVEDGFLNILSKKGDDGQYYSGAVTTQGKAMFLYGKLEIRAKLPSGKGIFPAFWMLPQSENELPEIDIIEYLGHEPSSVWHVLHYMDGGMRKRYYTKTEGDSYDQSYHVYQIEWTQDSLIWFIDGIQTFSITENVPSQPMCLYLNTAIGGNWPGDPDGTTAFPQTLKIDYVKYYSLI